MKAKTRKVRRPLAQLFIDLLKHGGKELRSYVNYRWLNITLASQIKAMRKQRGWSQKELAKRADLTAITIVRIEKLYWGKTSFSLTTLLKIAGAFGVALEARFGPWSRLIDEMTNTPYLDEGMSPNTFNIPSFAEEVRSGESSRGGRDD